jgi:hypothetical protein
MAAILSRNTLDGKNPSLPDNLTIREMVGCSAKLCSYSYTLAAGQVENRMVEDKNNLDLMRRQAHELVIEGHPDHSVDAFWWKGPREGWESLT